MDIFLVCFCFLSSFGGQSPRQIRINGLVDMRLKQYAMKSGYALLPACLFFIVAAFIGGIENPLFAQLTVHLCKPATSNAITLLPPPFNTKYDQLLAGVIMMGLHKSALVMTLALENKLADALLKSEKGETYPSL